MIYHSFPACAFFFFFFKVEISSRTLVVSLSSLLMILRECSIIHSPPAFFVCLEVEFSSRTLIPLFYARISPQWLSERGRQWPNVP